MATKLCYALGGIPYQATNISLGLSFQIFLLDVVQVREVSMQTLTLLTCFYAQNTKVHLRSFLFHNTATFDLTFCCQKIFFTSVLPEMLKWFAFIIYEQLLKAFILHNEVQQWCGIRADHVFRTNIIFNNIRDTTSFDTDYLRTHYFLISCLHTINQHDSMHISALLLFYRYCAKDTV